MLLRAAVLLVLVSAAVGCGDSDSESSFTVCRVLESDCVGGTCRDVEECEIDECRTDVDYEFDETEYETRCEFGVTRTTIEYPLGGGPGSQVVRRDIDECFYESEFDGNDFEEEGRCTRVRDCTVEVLDCDDSDPGDPDCRVVDSAPCGAAAGAQVS